MFSCLIMDSFMMCQGIWKEISRCSKDYFLLGQVEVPLVNCCSWDLIACLGSYHCQVPKLFRVEVLPEWVQ